MASYSPSTSNDNISLSESISRNYRTETHLTCCIHNWDNISSGYFCSAISTIPI